jgi:regulator of nonsense transcripts 3
MCRLAQNKSIAEGGVSRPNKGKGTADRQSEARSATHDAESTKAPKTKTPHEGEKVIIRRLPPGLTEAEFVSNLGSEWAVGNGKVDWFYYAPGKVCNEYVLGISRLDGLNPS